MVGEKALAHYAKLRIDAHTKRLVFSDGLDLERAFALYRHFADRDALVSAVAAHGYRELTEHLAAAHPAPKSPDDLADIEAAASTVAGERYTPRC